MKILIVEDDELTARALETVLSQQSYAIEIATDGEAAWDLVQVFDYDLVLLDVLLPDLDGVSLCRRMRSHHYDMPIMLLTAKGSSHDKALGLDAGADDYVTKPFDSEELLARVRALLRRASDQISAVLEWGPLELDPESCEVTYGGYLVPLTPKEYALMELLLRNPRRVFSCGMIIEHLWTYEDTPSEDAVRTHIKCVRQKLKKAGAPNNAVDTVYGIGYRLGPPAELASSSVEHHQTSPLNSATKASKNVKPTAETASPKNAPSIPTKNTKPSPEISPEITRVWQQFQPRIKRQIDEIEAAILAFFQHTLSPEQRAKAERNAHSLKGAIGTFGFPEGSRLAGELEQQLGDLEAQYSEAEVTATPSLEGLLQQVLSLRQAINPEATDETEPEPISSFKEQNYILVVDDDTTAVEVLIEQTCDTAIQVVQVKTLTEARRQLKQSLPQAVLFDPAIHKSPQTSLNFLEELSNLRSPPHIFIWSADNSQESRLATSSHSKPQFFNKSVSPSQLLDSIQKAINQISSNEGRILIVDDDPVILAALAQLLQPWGFYVATLSDPRKFWQTLEQEQPDLLVLDVKMPHVTGLELCQILRNDERWSSLAILILTAQTGTDIVTQVFAAGADDFIQKPVIGPELVVRITNRIERTKLFKRMLQTDPLTGVLNYQHSSLMLQQQLEAAHHNKQSFCLALVDIKEFRQVNRLYGHSTGDAVLYHIAQAFTDSLGPSEIVGRWGGEEFVIGFNNCQRDAAISRLQKILHRLQNEGIKISSDFTINPTFKYGVAQLSSKKHSLDMLYQFAEDEMYSSNDTMLHPAPSTRSMTRMKRGS